MAGFFQGCKITAYCVFMSLSTQSTVKRLAARDDLTEQELIEAAVQA